MFKVETRKGGKTQFIKGKVLIWCPRPLPPRNSQEEKIVEKSVLEHIIRFNFFVRGDIAKLSL